jgi:Protein of unknown function (DUF1553)/Protein of unknown function (DUF1549)/Planctomycete cytochrome C
LVAWRTLSGNSEKVDFSTQIKPIINKNCITCHGGVKRLGGFSLLFRSDALEKNKSGKAAIVPFHPEQSEFIKRLKEKDEEERMPYKAAALKPEEVELLTKWVKQGAEWGDHWAYVAPKQVEVPNQGVFASLFSFSRWERNEIDYFIKDKLSKEGLKPSQEANKATLLRRVYLDLTGLPPTTKQLDSYLKDDNENAYEKVVDDLLKKPQFGEKWASMWLDLARYSDSRGYQKDNGRNIWKYRDWVIKAFNQNMPFDQFTTEQIAGDLLQNRNGEPPTNDQLIATAFHRNTMNNDETGTVDEEFRVSAVLDRVSTTWDAFHGTTFACVQCHSHPYDPFRHEEFYKFMAFFNNTRDEDTGDEAPNLREFNDQDSKKMDSLKTWINTLPKENKSFDLIHFAKFLEPRFHAHYADNFVEGTLSGGVQIALRPNGTCRLPDINLNGMAQFVINYSAKSTGGVIEVRDGGVTGKVLIVSKLDTTKNKIIKLSLPKLEGRHDLYLVGRNPKIKDPREDVFRISWFTFMPDFPQKDVLQEKRFWNLVKAKTENTPILQEMPSDYSRKSHVFTRGNWLVHGQEVQPDVPKSLHKFPVNAPYNRLGLAKWLTSKEDPLTARTVVNRFWEQLFGIGIVETLEDFGTQGFKPTNLELLDYLAVKFMNDYHWKPKELLKVMVMSATYRQSSVADKNLLEKDPQNRLLARGPRVRLSAEQVRDQTLSVCGLLSNKMYGKPVMPYQPDGVWAAVNSNLNYKQSEGEEQYRRAIYTFARRTGPYPSMFSFDSPSREICMARRIRTNTPLQALVLLNDPVFVEASTHLAQKMLENGGKNADNQIKLGYRMAMLHDISEQDFTAFIKLYNASLKRFKAKPESAKQFLKNIEKPTPELAALAIVANSIINLDEFVTKD